MEALEVYVPFVFSNSVDPRAVFTVGDQLLSEHLFAFHFSATMNNSKNSLFSQIKIDRENGLVTFELKRKVFTSDGTELTPEKIFNSIKSSFSNTQHTKYSQLVESITRDANVINVKFRSIPINLEYWLRSIDFAIVDIDKLPINGSQLYTTTGPYSIVSLSSSQVELKRNKYFPSDFVSNMVESVIFKSYASRELKHLFSNVENFNLAYLYGYAVNQELIDSIKDKNLKIQIFPNEWMVYLGFQKNLSYDERSIIFNKIDSIKNKLINKLFYGTVSYSTVPSDRAYGLSQKEYEANKPVLESKASTISRKLILATLDEWADIPIFSYTISELEKEFSLEIKKFNRSEMFKIYHSDYADFYISPMGISPADPLGNYSFLYNNNALFSENISDESITELYKENEFKDFSKKVKDIELRILKKSILIPLGHFPGIIVESPALIRDESKSWDWGIQAWTYKIK
ncbi:MAG: hypothetical protein AB7I27_15675 [Bacteriovoracaceae bacterium]